MVRLSYSSLNLLHSCPHNWLNKMSSIPQPDKPEFKEGRESHSIIQAHVSGKKPDDRINLELKFPIVEEVDFDNRCKFSFNVGKYEIMGFVDGRDLNWNTILEIKTSSSPWALSKYIKSIQRKIYALSHDSIHTSFLITGQRDPSLWKNDPLKYFEVPVGDSDRKEAQKWILDGISILESGDFTKDLVDGKCTNPYCFWGSNCQFKL